MVGNEHCVSFVVLTWNSASYVRACIESVLGLGDLLGTLYAVDNGSSDGTLGILSGIAARDRRLRVLPQSENLGTTVSRNIALRIALEDGSGYVCVLDSDTVVSRAAIEEAVAALVADPSIGVAGPTLVSPDGLEQMSGRSLPTLGIKLRKAFPVGRVQESGERMERPAAPVVDGVQDVGYLISACWVMPISTLRRIGLLDERIFYAPEDADFCIRVWRSGLRCVRVHGEPIVHLYQRISKRRLVSRMNLEHVKGLARYFLKHRYLFNPGIPPR